MFNENFKINNINKFISNSVDKVIKNKNDFSQKYLTKNIFYINFSEFIFMWKKILISNVSLKKKKGKPKAYNISTAN